MKLYFKPNFPTKFHESISSMDYFFLIERNKWTFTETLSDADIVPISLLQLVKNPDLADLLTEDQIALVWHVETSGDHNTPVFYRDIIENSSFYKKHNKVIVVHTNLLDNYDPQYINHSIMFNRQKLYFTEYQPDLCMNKHWVYALPKDTYSLTEIKKTFNVTNKIFLIANRVKADDRPGTSFGGIKIQLKNMISSLGTDKMYYSDPTNGIYLDSNGWNRDLNNTIDIKGGGLFSPVADVYYNTSYISVGIESLVNSDEIFYPSEKYYNHFIKGNFPLIFSGPKVVERLSSFYGFKFPDWIDYSYDTIPETHIRFDSFADSINKLANMSIHDLHDLYLRDKYILDHNRNVFFTRPYDSLYENVAKSITQLNWKIAQNS